MRLDQPVEYIKGVGPVRAALLKEAFEIETALDLLLQLPYRFIDKTQVTPIHLIKPDMQWVCVRGNIIYTDIVGQGRKRRFVAQIRDNTGVLELVWFQGVQWLEKYIRVGQEYLVYGKLNNFNGTVNLPHPEMESVEPGQGNYERLMPIYSTTEKLTKAGFDVNTRRKVIVDILRNLDDQARVDFLPEQILKKYNFISYYQCLVKAHFPRHIDESEEAKRRLIYSEFFVHQCRLILQKLYRKANVKGYAFQEVGMYFEQFYKDYLPFALTNAQKRVIKEIRRDMGSGFQTNRLIQGDVGSGKTVVALICALIASGNGFQSCIMAPLEILAQQHYRSIVKLTEGMGFRTALLTGSTKKKERTELMKGLASGEIHLLVGTHAITEDPVVFKQLGLAIIDEQHRFGVEQRAKLWKKSAPYPPHVLVMTATPIPRTLALSIYGDLDISIIDELPPGRKPIVTKHVTEFHRPEMLQFVRTEIAKGRQIFFVFPLIEENEKSDLENLEIGYDRLRAEFSPPEFFIAIVHGKMKADEKASEMKRFIDKKAHILVSTTVIEVGVDIPNATVMVIENADRFGLSQLHQLRGRVGRGADQSYCILMTGFRLTKDARTRINTMVSTNDGFKIAEVDMDLRGPGSLEGTRQSGKVDLKIAQLSTHLDIFNKANQDATAILEEDPKLEHPENSTFRRYLQEIYFKTQDWSNIG